MKITTLALFLSISLFLCGNAFAAPHSHSAETVTPEHCGGTAHDANAATTQETTGKRPMNHLLPMTNHQKECSHSSHSMKSCCTAPALQISDSHLEAYAVFSDFAPTSEGLSLQGLKESIFHPPILLS